MVIKIKELTAIKKITGYLSMPIFLSSLICIFLFYSGFFFRDSNSIENNYRIQSLIDTKNIKKIEGTMLSSPIKSSSGKTYSSTLKVMNIQDSRCISSSAKGQINIYIPSNLVEAYYPGKLYSSSKSQAFLFETGGIYTFTGSFNGEYFIVTECNNCFWKKNFNGKLIYFRALCRLQFKRLMYSWKDGGGLLLALFSGAKEYTDDSIKEAFKNAGLSHILALSGMHLSMFSSIANFIGKKTKSKKLSYFLRTFTLIIFVWFAGFSPSLLRAFLCSSILLILSLANYQQPDMIIILSLSFIIQSNIAPNHIKNLGFILSYTALIGILVFNRLFQILFNKLLPPVISNSFSVSTSAQLFTAPISLKLIGTFCPIGIIATAVISPLISLFVYSGLILIILSLIIPFLSELSGNFINFLYTVIKIIVLFFSKAPRISN